MLELSVLTNGRRGDFDSKDNSRQPEQQTHQIQDPFSDHCLQSFNFKFK